MHLMRDVKCPFCNKIQTGKPEKSWSYGKLIEQHTYEKITLGAKISCSRYLCTCGKKFNYYKSTKKTWTIPRTKI